MFFPEVMFVPSVHQKYFSDWAEQGANRRGLTFPVDWHPLRAFLVKYLASRSQNIRFSPFSVGEKKIPHIHIYIYIYIGTIFYMQAKTP